MFVHLVLIKLKPGIARSDSRVQAWEAAFKALPQYCTGIVRFEYGWNTTNRPIAYDFGVNMAFATRRSRRLRPESQAPGGRGVGAGSCGLAHLRLRGCRLSTAVAATNFQGVP